MGLFRWLFRKRTLVEESSAIYDLTPREIEHKLIELSDISGGEVQEVNNLSAVTAMPGGEKYEWSVEESNKKGHRIIERRYLPKFESLQLSLLDHFPPILIGVLITAATYHVATPGTLPELFGWLFSVRPETPEYTLVVNLLSTVGWLVLPFVVLFVGYRFYRSLKTASDGIQLVEDRDNSRGYKSYTGPHLAVQPTLVAILGLGFVLGSYRIGILATLGLGAWAIFVACFVLFDRSEWLIRIEKRWRPTRLFPRYGKLSLKMTIVTAITLFGLATLRVIYAIIGASPWGQVVDLLLSGLLCLLGYVLFTEYLNEQQILIEENLYERPEYRPSRIGAIVILLAQMGLNVAILVAIILLWVPWAMPINVSPTGLALSRIIATGLGLYIPLGAVYQWWEQRKSRTCISERIEPYDVDSDIEFSYPVRRSDSAIPNARAVAIDGEKYIVVTSALTENLDPDELAAIAAHEEAHLEHNDTQLLRWLHTAATALFIGRNLLYELVDFYEREKDADDYAAKKAGSDNLADALQSIKELAADEDIDTSEMAATGAKMMPRERNGSVEQSAKAIFQVLSDGQAKETYPDISERIDRLKKEHENM